VAGAVQNSPLHCMFLLQMENEKDRTQHQLSPLLYICQKYMKSFNLYGRQLLLLLKFMFNLCSPNIPKRTGFKCRLPG
jgi:hypothetical protein